MTEETKHACPCGVSSDGFSIYEDGKGVHCYSCEGDDIPKDYHAKRYRALDEGCSEEDILEAYKNGEDVMPALATTPAPTELKGVPVFKDLSDRGLKSNICQVYGVKSTATHQIYPYYDGLGNKVATKMRGPDKTFAWGSKGDPKKVTLFGQQAFPIGQKGKWGKTLCITEGECDAMAALQMSGNKYAYVSIPHGAGSAKKILKNQSVYEYINAFDKIVLCMDSDAQGQKATSEMAEILDTAKVYVFNHLKGMKDANDYLLKGKSVQFMKRYWDAEKYSPEDIVLGSDEKFKQDVLYGKKSTSYTYPWHCLNDKTRGLRTAEMVTWIADTGVGKSQVLRELEHYYATTTFADGEAFKVGIIHIEETPRGAMIGLLSVDLRERLHLKDAPVPPDGNPYEVEEEKQVSQAVEDSYDKLKDRVAFYKEWGSNDADNIMNKISFFVKALGCKVIFLDHISMLVSDQRHLDERRALDEISSKLKDSTIAWNYSLQIVAHTNRQGEIRGTANIEKLSDMVIRLERDKNNENDYIANVTKITCEKNRYSGDTGVVGWLHYSKDTGAMSEVTDPVDNEFEEV
tara:strand:+ start:7864 stop:9585 length:1722 start_codon:yes stop_codon:yes gene_type:complete